jgi:hypothetical protein
MPVLDTPVPMRNFAAGFCKEYRQTAIAARLAAAGRASAVVRRYCVIQSRLPVMI